MVQLHHSREGRSASAHTETQGEVPHLLLASQKEHPIEKSFFGFWLEHKPAITKVLTEC